MIELLAAFLKTSVADAVNYLVAKGLINNTSDDYSKRVSEYLNKQIAYRNKLLSFWNMIKGCKERMTKEHELILTTMLGITPSETISSLFGFTTRKEAIKNFRVSDTAVILDGGCNRVFKGDGWGDVCALAAFDMPGRIKTLMFFGKPSDGGIQIGIRHVCYRIWTRPEGEAGLVFLEDVIDNDSKSLIVETDCITGIQLVSDYIDKYKKMPPLAVMAADAGRSTNAWATLTSEGKEVIVTGPRADELLSISPVLFDTKFKDDWRNTWVGSARWVSNVISKKLLKKPIVETPPLIVTKSKTVKYKGVVYEECPVTFTIKKNGKVIADVIVRIEKLIMKSDSKVIYKGYVENTLGKASFKLKDSQLTGATFLAWIKTFCLKNGLGYPICSKPYTVAIKKIIFLFSKPKVIKKRIKTDTEEYAYKFSGYNIKPSGKVQKLKKFKKKMGSELCLFEDLTIFEKEELGAEESALAWAAIICVLANALARRFNKTKIGIAIDEECSASIKKIVRLLGVYNDFISNQKRLGKYVSVTIEKEALFDLPVLISPVSDYSKLKHITVQQLPGERNCIIEMNKLAFYGSRTISRWAYINDHKLVITDHLSMACRKITINFLSWFLSNKYKPSGSNLIERTTDALSSWCKYNDISCEGLLKGLSLIDHDLNLSNAESRSEAFKSLISRLMHVSNFNHHEKKKAADGCEWIACGDFYSACLHRGIPTADRSDLSKDLIDTGTVQAYDMIRDTQYRNKIASWLIKSDDLNEWLEKNV